jgi:tRNA(Ile)-lysidine synthase
LTNLASRVLAAIRRDGLIARGDRVIAGVSGGADSVALAHLLVEVARSGALEFVGVAHLNHLLRGEASDRDEAFSRQVAHDCKVAFDVERCDVAATVGSAGRSLEEAAREARYAYLERARQRLGADLVAVAHSLDDQAETVLMRLLSGAGTRGLGAMKPRRGRIVRPLLDVRRGELRAYLDAHGIGFVEDESNRDLSRRRNRLRHELLPRIVEVEGDTAVEAIVRTARIAQADEALLDGLTIEAAGRVTTSESPLRLDAVRLGREPLGLRRRIVRRAVEQVTGRAPSFRQVEAIVTFLDQGGPGTVPVSGGHMELSPDGGVLFSVAPSRRHVEADWRPWQYTLPVPGRVAVVEASGVIWAQSEQSEESSGSKPDRGVPWQVRLSREVVGDVLTVRAWKPGDRVRLPWGIGRKKVQDIFVDCKVPRSERHAIPLVVAGNGQILWVAGHAVAGGAMAGSATKSVVVLSFEPFGRSSK